MSPAAIRPWARTLPFSHAEVTPTGTAGYLWPGVHVEVPEKRVITEQRHHAQFVSLVIAAGHQAGFVGEGADDCAGRQVPQPGNGLLDREQVLAIWADVWAGGESLSCAGAPPRSCG